jgi:hypothetical protein
MQEEDHAMQASVLAKSELSQSQNKKDPDYSSFVKGSLEIAGGVSLMYLSRHMKDYDFFVGIIGASLCFRGLFNLL